jgi:hypothetical protein
MVLPKSSPTFSGLERVLPSSSRSAGEITYLRDTIPPPEYPLIQHLLVGHIDSPRVDAFLGAVFGARSKFNIPRFPLRWYLVVCVNGGERKGGFSGLTFFITCWDRSGCGCGFLCSKCDYDGRRHMSCHRSFT